MPVFMLLRYASSLPGGENFLTVSGLGFCIPVRCSPPAVFGFVMYSALPSNNRYPSRATCHAVYVHTTVVTFFSILDYFSSTLSTLIRLLSLLFAPQPTPQSSVLLPPPRSASSSLIPPIPVLCPPLARQADHTKIVDHVTLCAVDAVEEDRASSAALWPAACRRPDDQVHHIVAPLSTLSRASPHARPLAHVDHALRTVRSRRRVVAVLLPIRLDVRGELGSLALAWFSKSHVEGSRSKTLPRNKFPICTPLVMTVQATFGDTSMPSIP